MEGKGSSYFMRLAGWTLFLLSSMGTSLNASAAGGTSYFVSGTLSAPGSAVEHNGGCAARSWLVEIWDMTTRKYVKRCASCTITPTRLVRSNGLGDGGVGPVCAIMDTVRGRVIILSGTSASPNPTCVADPIAGTGAPQAAGSGC